MDKVVSIFQYLNNENIKYLLLRPISFLEGFNDIDLLVSKTEFFKMVQSLKKSDFTVYYQRTNSNESIKLHVDDFVLDVQFYVSFLPYKTLVIKNEELPFGGVKIIDDHYIFPEVKEEILFTFWVHRLFLDKDDVNDAGSFKIFKVRYQETWEELIQSTFFINWTNKIYLDNDIEVIEYLKSFFVSMTLDNKLTNQSFKRLIYKGSFLRKINAIIDQVKFKVLRRLGRYNKKIPLNKMSFYEV